LRKVVKIPVKAHEIDIIWPKISAKNIVLSKRKSLFERKTVEKKSKKVEKSEKAILVFKKGARKSQKKKQGRL
jgi:hypothetical protein